MKTTITKIAFVCFFLVFLFCEYAIKDLLFQSREKITHRDLVFDSMIWKDSEDRPSMRHRMFWSLLKDDGKSLLGKTKMEIFQLLGAPELLIPAFSDLSEFFDNSFDYSVPYDNRSLGGSPISFKFDGNRVKHVYTGMSSGDGFFGSGASRSVLLIYTSILLAGLATWLCSHMLDLIKEFIARKENGLAHGKVDLLCAIAAAALVSASVQIWLAAFTVNFDLFTLAPEKERLEISWEKLQVIKQSFLIAENTVLIFGILCALFCFLVARRRKTAGNQSPNILLLAAYFSILAAVSTGIMLDPLINWLFYGAGSYSFETMLFWPTDAFKLDFWY